jgi:hypothetical protein
MITIIISVLSVSVVILLFTTINLLRKNEKAEDIIFSQKQYIDSISKTIYYTDKKLKEIDEKGIFKSDDEVGFFFDMVKQIQDILNQYKLPK